MPTAVLDLDLENLPVQIDNLTGYRKALCLLRFRSKPVGQKILPVKNGQIIIKDFYHEICEAAGYRLPIHWLHQYLDWDKRKVNGFRTPTATIAICTRNRAQDLKRCLDALMKLPEDGQEILVIDNCPSTNETHQLVATYPGVRYVCEPRPGLNIARNRALQEAQHEVVAFTDDDAVPDSIWLRALVS
ncbi:MAG: glycosyltransferase family 2 protein, partial [Chitinophagaceae bacterium]